MKDVEGESLDNHARTANICLPTIARTSWSLRDLQAFFWLFFFCSRTESTPAHQRVMLTVGRLVTIIWSTKFAVVVITH